MVKGGDAQLKAEVYFVFYGCQRNPIWVFKGSPKTVDDGRNDWPVIAELYFFHVALLYEEFKKCKGSVLF